MDMMKLVNYYLFDFWMEHGDARTADLPLMSGGPSPILLIILLYVSFVKIIGPKFMMDRKPLSLRPLMLFFNSFMLAVNALGFAIGLLASDFGSRLWSCRKHSFNDPDHFKETLLLYLGYLYMCARILDMADTIFFVMRKKYNNVSCLHVFHHSMVPLIAFMGLKLHPYPNAGFLPMSNVFVHTLMYAYYAMSCMGPEMSKYIWWKKHLTQLQLLQFVSVFAHAVYTYLTPDCQFPKLLSAAEMNISILFFLLFGKFYCDTYHINITGNKYKHI